jgi:hypothetical protein
MGTGVGEAALAAEAIGAAEAATAGAGFLEGMAGVSALEGAGVAGLGLGTGAGLGTALAGAGAGGLGALSPAFQTALGQTAAVMPEVAAQTAQFANMGAMPGVDAVLGAGQIGDPTLLAQQFGSGIQNVTPGVFNELGAVETADLMKNIDPRLMQGYMPMDTPNAANMAEKARFADYWAKYPSTLSTAATPADVAQAMDAGFNPATATTEMGGNLARQMINYVDPADMARASVGAETTSPWSGLKNLTQPLQNWWDDQNKLTKYGLGATAAMQAAKYLNKTPGAPGAEKYNGPLSKFTYSPDTYRPYTYKPYAAGGPVEEMSNRNAIGANTGYPQSDIQQGAYATPRQTPVSRNVVAGAGDVGVDQMTGMERMAEGGATEAKPEMPAVAASQQNFSDFLSRYQGAPEQAGLTPFNPTEQAMPEIMASRQNFADFLARYQNLPITEAAPPPVVYKDLYAAGPGPKEDVNPARPAYESFGGYIGAKAGGLMASGGIADLGGYSDGGRLLRGPGDGMSDNIPATIGRKQPARLADGEFVVPADVVSGLGNGSTEAGAKQLYKMLDKVRSARTGTKKQGKQIKPEKYTPA